MEHVPDLPGDSFAEINRQELASEIVAIYLADPTIGLIVRHIPLAGSGSSQLFDVSVLNGTYIVSAAMRRMVATGPAWRSIKASPERPETPVNTEDLGFEKAMIEPESEIVELRAQLERYEELRSGRAAKRTLTSLRKLPVALIEGRIAARLTQREFAQRLGVPEQQVQRWEANGYAGVSVDRLQDIADALGLRLSETVAYAVCA